MPSQNETRFYCSHCNKAHWPSEATEHCLLMPPPRQPLPAHDAPQVECVYCKGERVLRHDMVIAAGTLYEGRVAKSMPCESCAGRGVAHGDSQPVERFKLRARVLPAQLRPDSEGDWVRYTDYATLEAEKQQLEAENREARQKLDMADWNKAIGKMRIGMPDYQARAEAAESQLHTLREAVRELLQRDPHDLDISGDQECVYCDVGETHQPKHTDNCEWAKLRALVTPQGEK